MDTLSISRDNVFSLELALSFVQSDETGFKYAPEDC